MKVLVIGSGAREHAITWKFANSNCISALYIAPGNAGTAELGKNLPEIDPMDIEGIVKICREKEIDMVFVGPEGPLAAGLVDRLSAEKIRAIGPKMATAQLESSKVFSKDFMVRNGIPTAFSETFEDYQIFERYLKKKKGSLVLKKNGLAAGKGVYESEDTKNLLAFGKKVLPGDSILVEEFLTGWEISVFALTDGNTYLLLPPCADYKKAEEGDKGLNTGGMGAVCPVPQVTSALWKTIEETIINPTFTGLAKEGLSFSGVLFFGLMITEEGPKLLEYNVRFGDPEAQVLLPLLECDFGNLAEALYKGSLKDFYFEISNDSVLGVVVAAEGYPESCKKGIPVTSLPKQQGNDLMVFHASTGFKEDGTIVTGGGRCFSVVGKGRNILEARTRAYEGAQEVSFRGAWFRKDIGNKFYIVDTAE